MTDHLYKGSHGRMKDFIFLPFRFQKSHFILCLSGCCSLWAILLNLTLGNWILVPAKRDGVK